MDTLISLLGRNGFLPHGYCFTWSPGLLWAMVGADAVIAAAYFSIPVATVSYIRRRPEASTNWLAWLFSAFIFACGVTHVMDIWTIWQPDYGLQALTKIVTAAISLATAMALWPLIPRALKIPSVQQLRSVIGELEAEVGRRRSAEEQLAAIQQSLAVTLASIDAGFLATDRNGKVTHMNAVAETVTGWSQRDAMGQDLWTVFEREDRPAAYLPRNPVDLMLEQQVTVDTEQRLVAISRAGTRTPLELKAALMRSDDGQISGMAMVFRNMTRQRRAEAALRDSEAQLRFTLEAARVGDWLLDLETGLMQHSARHDRCFGYAEAQANWNFDTFIRHVHEDDRAEVELTLQRAVKEERDWRIQCRVVWPDGSVHWISKHGSMQLQGDKATRMLGIVSDITEQRQAENARLTAQRLEAENRQIQEASRLKSLFLANMSHELRTPLNAVIGFADLLHSGFIKPDSPKHQEFLGHIGTSGRHLLQLINDVLDLSKVESGKFDFFPEPVNLAVLMQEVQDVLHTALSRKAIHITTQIDPEIGDLLLDPARLKQVLYNYLSNAIKFTAAGGRVALRALAEGPDHFRIEVADTGIGISPADLPRLFTEFQQLDAGYSKQHQGTGLGLALTRRLVQAQGGQVGVRSTVGAGSVFYAVLNRQHGLDSRRAESAAQAPYAPQADRVLVIEHDERDQARLVEALSRAGFQVDAATDGPHALRRARATAYAALTLDLSLPGQRGLALLDDIRSQGASHASPVLGVSMAADPNLSAAFSIANVLSKPIRSDEIWSALSRYRLHGEARANVMVIDDEALSLDLMRTTLKSIGVEAVCFQDGRVALQEIDRHRPDAIVLDLMMPGFDGFQVLDALQRLPAWREVPVFIWTSMLLTDDEYATLARSVRAILLKGGGAMDAVLDRLRRLRLRTVADDGTVS
jgi:PAS domain S-box-containing protein